MSYRIFSVRCCSCRRFCHDEKWRRIVDNWQTLFETPIFLPLEWVWGGINSGTGESPRCIIPTSQLIKLGKLLVLDVVGIPDYCRSSIFGMVAVLCRT